MLTLESTLVVSLAVGLIAWSLVQAPPLYRMSRQAARLEVLATIDRVAGASLYRIGRIALEPDQVVSVQVSPQRLLECAGLVRDTIHLAGRLIGDTGGTKRQETGP